MKFAKPGLCLLLAAFMLFMGSQKFGDANPVFAFIADRSGLAFFEPQLRMLTGALEVLAALLLVVGVFTRRLEGFGSLLSLAVIGGAIIFHLSPWLGINAPVALAEDGSYIHSPMLFGMAVVFGALAAVLTWLDRDRLPIIGKG
ncbi:DoxX family protein [Maricaulis sp.]|uniref:DoxX family protein n=1 Tax=Maricaulis sp. TaxID=1486257 RepID=UPI0025BCACD6|nr:DoxX family protein [Maricaulis sp.]